MHFTVEVKDVYIRYTPGGDQTLGRFLSGLPINAIEFALLPPHFKEGVDAIVTAAIKECFPPFIVEVL